MASVKLGKSGKSHAPSRIFIVGLDGATFDLIEPLVQKGKLPNIARLMQNGTYGTLESVIHPLTPSAWTSFMTGKNPGKHGIFDFMTRKPNSYNVQYFNAGLRHGATLWEILSQEQRKVGVFNVPVTYPVEVVNGFMVSGFGTPGRNVSFTYPLELQKEIIRKFGPYILFDYDQITKTPKAFIEFEKKCTARTLELAKYLMKKDRWDFFMVVFNETDHIQHYFWHCMDPNHPSYTLDLHQAYGNAIYDTYQGVDVALGELMNNLPDDTTIIVMSDHGLGPTKKLINLHKWLEENGLFSFKTTPSNLRALFSVFSGTIREILRKYLPRRWKNEILKLFPGFQSKIDSHLFSSEIDWKNTKAYTIGYFGSININLKGREPLGIVKQGKEYKELCEFIKEKLSLLRDPETGDRVIDKVYHRNELYHGPYIERAPDLIVIYKDFDYYSYPRLKLSEAPSIFETNREATAKQRLKHLAHHRLNGICLFSGKNIRENHKIKNAKIIDLTPTILYLLDIAVPLDMDGRVLEEIFKEEYLEAHPVKYRDSLEPKKKEFPERPLSPKEADEIKAKLKGLGYLD